MSFVNVVKTIEINKNVALQFHILNKGYNLSNLSNKKNSPLYNKLLNTFPRGQVHKRLAILDNNRLAKTLNK